MSTWSWSRWSGVMLCVSLLSYGVACGDTVEDDTGEGQESGNNESGDAQNDEVGDEQDERVGDDQGDVVDESNNDGAMDDGPVCGDGVCGEGEDADSCAQDCAVEGPECGDGVCEEGEDAESCEADCDGEVTGGLCPPQGPFGNGEGDVAPDVVLMDCDGNPHSVRDLCARKVGWIFEFAAWCPPCRSFARDFEALMADFAGDDLGVLFVISSNDAFAEPSAEDCRSIRDAYGIESAPVLYDADGALQRELGVPANDIHIIMSEGNVIEFKRQYSSRDVPGELRRLLDE